MRAIIAAAALAALPTPALADGSLFLRFGAAWITDRAFDLVAETDAAPQVLVGGGWGASDVLTLELAYGMLGASARSFGDAVESSLFVHQFQGAAVFHLPMSEHFAGRLRGAAAFEMASLDVEAVGGSALLEDFATGLGLEGTLGLELRLPVAPGGDPGSTRLAFLVEAGWSWHPFGFDFDGASVDRDGDADPPPLAAEAIDVGSLDLSGPLLRFGVSLAF